MAVRRPSPPQPLIQVVTTEDGLQLELRPTGDVVTLARRGLLDRHAVGKFANIAGLHGNSLQMLGALCQDVALLAAVDATCVALVWRPAVLSRAESETLAHRVCQALGGGVLPEQARRWLEVVAAGGEAPELASVPPQLIAEWCEALHIAEIPLVTRLRIFIIAMWRAVPVTFVNAA